jgi:hypothetical protein
MSETVQEQRDHAYAASGHMDVSTSFDAIGEDPEQWSAGAVWCRQVWDAAREAYDGGRFDHEEPNYSGVVDELSGSLEPVYTHNRWQVFTDLMAYQSEHAEELIGECAYTDMTTLAGDVLERMAWDAVQGLVMEWRKENADDDDSDG